MNPVPSAIATPFERFRGDSANLALSLIDPDTGLAFNPTGCVLIFTLKKSIFDADIAALIQKISTVGGFTITNAAAGAVTLSLVPTDYASLVPGKLYQIDVQAQNIGTGVVKTVLRGTFIAERDVTQGTTISVPTTVLSPVALTFPTWRPDILGAVGGTGYIDGIATVGLSKTLPTLMLTFFGGKLNAWIYTAGTAATGNGVVQPLDFDPVLNAGQWTQIALQ